MDCWTRHYRHSCSAFTSKWLLLSIHRKGGRRMFKSQQPKHTNHRRIANEWLWRGREKAGAIRDHHTSQVLRVQSSSGSSNRSCKMKATLVFLSQPDRDSSDYYDFIRFQDKHWNPESVLPVPVKICLVYFCCQFKQEPCERKSHRGEDDDKEEEENLVAFQTCVLLFYLFKSQDHLWQKTYRFGWGQRSHSSRVARSFLRFPAHFHKQAPVFASDRSRPSVHSFISGVFLGMRETERRRDRDRDGEGEGGGEKQIWGLWSLWSGSSGQDWGMMVTTDGWRGKLYIYHTHTFEMFWYWGCILYLSERNQVRPPKTASQQIVSDLIEF